MYYKAFVLLMLAVLSFGRLLAQDDFCDAIGAILHDAPGKFRNIRGKLKESNANATIWDCGVRVPGTIKSRFVASQGLFYEGGFLQTANKDEVKGVYDRCTALLSQCLLPQGFKMTTQPNFYAGLGAYKKVVFMQELPASAPVGPPPAHIALEATYSKELGIYTVVMFIFEH